MKFTKRAVALVLSLVMVASLSAVLASADYSFVKNGAELEVADGVVHTPYTITSDYNGKTSVDAHALTFNPDDGYMPIVFSAYAGWCSTLGKQYEQATGSRYGYDVVAIINGSYFSMADGTLVGITISDSRVACAHVGWSGDLVTFGSDGSIRVVRSQLDYKLYINGKQIPNSLYYINKVSGESSVGDKFYYWDGACGSKADSKVAGYEILCNKTGYTDLMVGTTLKGEVVSVTADTYGGAIGDDQFILYCKADSPYADYVKDLKAGDSINISVDETVEESKDVMRTCVSAITNVGWLVKDGVDLTDTESTIGSHSVTLAARWTAFGTKPDGTFVLFTTDGAGTGSEPNVTLSDVAQAMIDLGCNNVFRLDGGGSSAMYVCNTGEGEAGFLQSSSRAVADTIMIVKRSSLAVSTETAQALADKIAEAEAAYAENPEESLKTAIDAAKAIADTETSVESEYAHAIVNLDTAMSGKRALEELAAVVGSISFRDYSEYALEGLRNAYADALGVIGDKNASADDIEAAYQNLLYWYNLSGDRLINIAHGKDYTYSTAPNGGYPDTNNSELTDGEFADPDNGFAPGWVGLNGKTSYDVVIDLGEVCDGLSKFNSNFLQITSWGISPPSQVTYYVSDDGNEWTGVGTVKGNELEIDYTEENGAYNFALTLDTPVSGRYVKATINKYSTFIFVSEIEVFSAEKTIDYGAYLSGFNQKIAADFCSIFTPSFGTITGENANPNWTCNIWLKWSDEIGAYVITKKTQGNGSFADYTLAEDEIMIAMHHYTEASDENNAVALAAKVGQVLRTSGINIEERTTDLAPFFWFEDYVPEHDRNKGDVNGNGTIDAADYLMTKRMFLGTFTPDAEQKWAADVDDNGSVNATDYLMIKRHFLGTYDIYAR
ncbi:MAG: phosphodiester glycosidase family protein [Eubacteriales bacterium]